MHAKLVIADDRVAVVGSNNVNDRSSLGDRDTEVALVVEDAAAVGALRRRLWRAHLGMVPATGDPSPAPGRPHQRKWDDDIDDVADPRVWQTVLDVCNLNSQLLEAAFDLAPWDDIATLEDARERVGLARLSRSPLFFPRRSLFFCPFADAAARRHVTAPPGTDDWRDQVRAVHNTLSGVRGELCAFPERFLHGETLAPSLLAKIFVGRKLFQ